MIRYDEFLIMKFLVENQKAEYEWIITNFGAGSYELTLDDGSQSYKLFTFNKNEYTSEDVVMIGKQLAKELGISHKL